jgi:hypothetical protein
MVLIVAILSLLALLAHAQQLANIHNIQQGSDDSIYGFEYLDIGEYLESDVSISISVSILYYYNLKDDFFRIDGHISTSEGEYGYERNRSINPTFTTSPSIQINDKEYQSESYFDYFIFYQEDLEFDQIYEKISFSINFDIDVYAVEFSQDDYTLVNKIIDLEISTFEETIYQVNERIVVFVLILLTILLTYLLYRMHAGPLQIDTPNLREQVVSRYILIPYSVIVGFAIITFDGYYLLTLTLFFGVVPILFELFVLNYRSKPILLENKEPKHYDKLGIRIDQQLFNKTVVKLIIFLLIILSLDLMTSGALFNEKTLL